MTLDIITSSVCPGRLDVRWSSSPAQWYHSYVVTVANEWENFEWMAVISDGSVRTIQLDTACFEQSGGVVRVQGCGHVRSEYFGTAYRVDDQSRTRVWRSQQSTSATGDVGLNNEYRGFISRIIWRLVPGILRSLVHWITSPGRNYRLSLD